MMPRARGAAYRRAVTEVRAEPVHATEVVDGAADADGAAELVLRFARVGHDAGYPTADLEDRLVAAARALGLEGAQVSATPTLIEVSIGSLTRQRTYILRVRPTTVDLDAIARLDDLARDLLGGRIDPSEARAALEEIAAGPRERPWPVLLVGYAAVGATLSPIIGGDWRETAAAALIGLIVGGIALSAKRGVRAEPILAPLAAIAASFCAVALVWMGLDGSPDVITLAALLSLVPGMVLTIGMRELATEHLQSGVANTANALVQLLGLVVGVGIGRSIAVSIFGTPNAVKPELAFSNLHLLAAAAAGLAFAVTLRAQLRDAPAMCGATVLALEVHHLGTDWFGAQAGVFAAALIVGVVGTIGGALLRRSPLVLIVPGVLMLVPGSAGFNSALLLLTNQTVTGITTAFDTLVTAIMIAYGLMVSTVLLPRRFAQMAPRDA
jgi:uncharacterized membrane protein YjjP (DUF1212 family)